MFNPFNLIWMVIDFFSSNYVLNSWNKKVIDAKQKDYFDN